MVPGDWWALRSRSPALLLHIGQPWRAAVRHTFQSWKKGFACVLLEELIAGSGEAHH